MKCIICGKELNRFQRKYCCVRCAQISYKSGKSEPKINSEIQVRELFSYFKKAFDFNGERFIPTQAWKARVFVFACYELGYSPNSIARGLKKDHSTILYHHNQASDKEKKLSCDFLKDTHKYRYINNIKPLRPEGFHY